MELISRKEAKKQGLKYYFTGEPCSNGHIGKRLVRDYNCCECAAEYNTNWKRETGYEKEYIRRQSTKARQSVSAKKWRDAHPDKARAWCNSEAGKLYISQWNKTDGRMKRWLSQAKARAKRNGLEFNLTLDDLIVPELCPVFGIPLIFSDRVTDNTPTIDRVDSSRGYTQDNIQIISSRANRLKNNATLTELTQLVEYVKQAQCRCDEQNKTLPQEH